MGKGVIRGGGGNNFFGGEGFYKGGASLILGGRILFFNLRGVIFGKAHLGFGQIEGGARPKKFFYYKKQRRPHTIGSPGGGGELERHIKEHFRGGRLTPGRGVKDSHTPVVERASESVGGRC